MLEMAAVSTEDARNLADGLVASGRDEEAVAVYLRALTLAPSQVDEAELSMELGWLLFSLGRPDEATAFAHRALRALEHHAATAQIAYLRGGSHSVLAHCVFDVDSAAGRATAEIALRALAPALSDPVGLPRSEIVWMWIDAARLSWLLGAADDCVAHCERALALEPTDAERLSCLAVYAEALRAKERFTEARERLIEALRYTKSYRGAAATLYFALGLTEHAANDLPRAHQALQETLSRGRLDLALPADSRFLRDTYQHLGLVSYELGLHEEAARALDAALAHCKSSDPARASIVLVQGHCRSALGRDAQARTSYEDVVASRVASEEDRESARSALAMLPQPTGWLHAFVRRVLLYAKIIHVHLCFYSFPMSPDDYYARLAAAHFGLGNFRRSTRIFEKSEAFRHSSAHELARYNAYYLGFGYMNLGEHQKACQWLERYLAYKPQDAYVRGVLGGLRPRDRSGSER